MDHEKGPLLVSRRTALATTAKVGAVAAAGGLFVLRPDVASAWNGAAEARIDPNGWRSYAIRFYGAGWNYSQITVTFSVYFDGVRVFRDTRLVWSTGFSFTHYYDCAHSGYLQAYVEAVSNKGQGPHNGYDVTLVV